MNSTKSVSTVSLLVLILLVSAEGQAISPHEYARETLVKLRASAVSTAPNSNGSRQTTETTGFLVDKYGLVATTYHLISGLEPYDEEIGITLTAMPEFLNGREVRVSIEAYSALNDALLLRIPESGKRQGYPFLRPTENPREKVDLHGTTVYSSGFPRGYPYKPSKGVIESFNGPNHQLGLWITDISAQEGLSGSPIYLEDGSYIGILKGSDTSNPPHHLLLPNPMMLRLMPRYLANSQHPLDNESIPRVASIEISGKITSTERETREITRRFYHRNDHCSGDSSPTWNISADREWQIDTASIDYEVTVQSSKSHFGGLANVSKSGFTLQKSIRNSGQCIFGGGDARGALAVLVSYEEYRNITKTTEETVSRVPVSIESPSVFDLNELKNLSSVTALLRDDKGAPIERLKVDQNTPAHRSAWSGFEMTLNQGIVKVGFLNERKL